MAIFALPIANSNPAYASDKAVPVLIDWVLSDSQPNLFPEGANFRVNFIISDESKLITPELFLQSKTSLQKSQLAQVTLMKKLGNLYSFTATVNLPKDSPPRRWDWVISPLRDVLGNVQGKNLSYPNFTFTVIALNESYTAKNALDDSFMDKALERYFKNIATLDNYGVRLNLALIANPNDPELLLAKLKKPSIPVTTPDDVNSLNQASTEIQIYNDALIGPLSQAERKILVKQVGKKTSSTCVKGKATKKVSAVKPKCPTGYKKK